MSYKRNYINGSRDMVLPSFDDGIQTGDIVRRVKVQAKINPYEVTFINPVFLNENVYVNQTYSGGSACVKFINRSGFPFTEIDPINFIREEIYNLDLGGYGYGWGMALIEKSDKYLFMSKPTAGKMDGTSRNIYQAYFQVYLMDNKKTVRTNGKNPFLVYSFATIEGAPTFIKIAKDNTRVAVGYTKSFSYKWGAPQPENTNAHVNIYKIINNALVLERTLTINNTIAAPFMYFTPDSKNIILHHELIGLKTYNLETGAEVNLFSNSPSADFWNIEFSNDGYYCALANQTSVSVYHDENGSYIFENTITDLVSAESIGGYSLTFSNDTQRLYIALSTDPYLYCFNTNDYSRNTTHPEIPQVDNASGKIIFINDMQFINGNDLYYRECVKKVTALTDIKTDADILGVGIVHNAANWGQLTGYTEIWY